MEQADDADPAGIVNSGYWGISLRAHTTYAGSFYAKGDTAATDPVTMRLVNTIQEPWLRQLRFHR